MTGSHSDIADYERRRNRRRKLRPYRRLPGACRHCGKERNLWPRQLCWTCYWTPDVREKYPAKVRRLGPGDFAGAAPPPDDCALSPPGSEGKIRVLGERFAAGRSLWHPDDHKIPD